MSAEPETLAYSLPQFAAAMGVSLTSIKAAIKSGELVPSYLRTKPLIPKTEGLRWIASLPEEPQKSA